MVYGPGDRQRRFAVFTQPFSIGARSLELPIEWTRWTTTYGYVDNVGAAVALASAADRSTKQIYNVGEETPVDHSVWAHRFAVAANWRGEIALVDDAGSPLAAHFADLDCTFPLIADTSKVRSQLGFRETVSLEEAVQRTYEHDLRTGWPGQARP